MASFLDSYLSSIPNYEGVLSDSLIAGDLRGWAQHEGSYVDNVDENTYSAWAAERANYWDMLEWQYAAALDMYNRDEERAYNDPSAQMSRLIAAGINPNYALGNVSAGATSQLSAPATHAANVPNISYEGDAIASNERIAAMQNATTSALGYGNMNVNQQNADTNKKVGDSVVTKNEKDALRIEQETEGERLNNKWKLESFDVRLNEESQRLKNLIAERDEIESRTNKNDADIKLLDSVQQKIDAETDLARERINEIRESLRLRQEEIKVSMMDAATRQGQLNLSKSEFQFHQQEFAATVKKWNNDALMQYLYKFGKQFAVSGKVEGKYHSGVKAGFGFGAESGFSAGGSVAGSYQQKRPASREDMLKHGIELITVGEEVIDRAAKNPSPESLKQAAEAYSIMQALQEQYVKQNQQKKPLYDTQVPISPYIALPSSTSVSNPFNAGEAW